MFYSMFPDGNTSLMISSWAGIIFTMFFCTMTIIEEIRKIKY